MAKNILLVDDDTTLIDSIAIYLISEGFSVNVAYSVYNAFSLIKKKYQI